jgi:hypothetical protein
LDQAWLPLGFKRATQIPDEHFEDVGVAKEILPPNAIHDLLARENLVGVSQEEAQEVKLARRQRECSLASLSGPPGEIQVQIVKLKGLARRGGGLAATEQCPDPSQQFLECKRFDEVIVGPGLKPRDPISDRIPRGQHQHGNGRATFGRFGRAESPANVNSVDAGQFQVENRQVRRVVAEEVKRRPPIPGHFDLEPFEDQATPNEAGDRRFILDDQNAGRAWGRRRAG